MSTNDSYRPFLESVQPLLVALDSCNASVDRVALVAAIVAEGEQDRPVNSIRANYVLKGTSPDVFVVTASVVVTTRVGNKPPPVLTIECVFEMTFKALDVEKQRQHVQRFIDTELRVIGWPFFREFVSATSIRMGIPNL